MAATFFDSTSHQHGDASISCPSCNATIDLSDSQRSLLDTIVAQRSEATTQRLLVEQERALQRSATTQVELALAQAQAQHQGVLAQRDAALAAAVADAKVHALELTASMQREHSELKAALAQQELSAQLEQRALRERFEVQLAEREEQIERLRDMRIKLSTKMVGETLEQHCENEFERVRALAFSSVDTRVSFGKDNDASSGSKADYIFREHDAVTGAELVSIAFEMKNEQLDGVSSKHRNTEFLGKLDKDRKEKGCEYAVLVSMLEPDSELYNTGIVDVSHLHPKMFVVRPQFFLVILGLIRSSAKSAANLVAQLQAARSSDVDVSAFEEDLETFKLAFGKNYDSSAKHLAESIDRIDKVLVQLNITRESLVTSQRQMRLANDKAQDVSLRKLARGNATVQGLISEVAQNREQQ